MFFGRLFSFKNKCACGFLGLRVKGLEYRSQVWGVCSMACGLQLSSGVRARHRGELQ